MQVGIDQIGLFTPDKYVDMVDLANARKQDPNKFLVGIGQREMSVADITQDAVSMGINATLKFIDKIDKNKVGLLIFGTESSIDQSKSASLFVKTALKLKPEVRTFEVKEACFGLTAALMMARDFVRVHPEQTAIVIGSDIARYGVNTAGEVTQGAGSVAMLIKADPSILALNNGHSAYSEDINDFWRPNYSRTALVDGKYSTQVYLDFFKKFVVAEDWDGFKELVSESDIEDKDLIIRVLSMYSDPAVREKEIKNMSEVYNSLKKEILPELRRARFIANVEFTNYSNDELIALIDENIDILDEEALLRAASVVKENADKVAIYKKAIEKYNSARAQYNLAVAYICANDLANAKAELAKAAKDADWQNAMGVIALREGDNAAAAKYFAAAGNATSTENAAVIDILDGKYADAAAKLASAENCCNKVLAYILTDQLDKASAAATCGCAKTSYLKAVIAARQGKADDVKKYIDAAGKDSKLAERAAKDIEFAQYR